MIVLSPPYGPETQNPKPKNLEPSTPEEVESPPCMEIFYLKSEALPQLGRGSSAIAGWGLGVPGFRVLWFRVFSGV